MVFPVCIDAKVPVALKATLSTMPEMKQHARMGMPVWLRETSSRRRERMPLDGLVAACSLDPSWWIMLLLFAVLLVLSCSCLDRSGLESDTSADEDMMTRDFDANQLVLRDTGLPGFSTGTRSTPDRMINVRAEN